MENEFDTETGGDEELSMEEAVAAYVKSTEEGAEEGQPEPDDDLEEGAEPDEEDDSDLEEDESEGEPDEDGQPDDEEDTEPESDGGRFVASNGKVRLPDGTVSTVEDLIQGNLRERDYRQKTMAHADEKRQFERQSSDLQASMQKVEEERQYLQQMWESMAPQQPNMVMLDPNSPEYDPMGYTEQKARLDNFHAHLNYMQQQQAASKQQTEARTQQERRERMAREWEALQSEMPELKDQAKLTAFTTDIKSAAQAAGFSLQEIAENVPLDRRMAIVLQKAAKWDRLQSSKPKAAQKMQGRPPVQKGGKRLTAKAQRARRSQDAFSRLKETGSVEDAAAAYLASQKG